MRTTHFLFYLNVKIRYCKILNSYETISVDGLKVIKGRWFNLYIYIFKFISL